jgi:hypothetical protein
MVNEVKGRGGKGYAERLGLRLGTAGRGWLE